MSTPRPFEIGLFTFGEITADPTTGRSTLPSEVLPVVRRETSRHAEGVA